MRVIEGSTVDHFPERIDWVSSTAVSECGEEGEPVDKAVEDVDLCSRCRDALDDAQLPEELIEDEDEVDDGDHGD